MSSFRAATISLYPGSLCYRRASICNAVSCMASLEEINRVGAAVTRVEALLGLPVAMAS